ncbi:hypothetical protein Trydic_g1365 [Trypoxylus dichotomus]
MSRVPLVRDYYPPVSPLCPVSPGAAARDLWIGEETKRAMPPHVYKYYLQRTKCYRRQSIKFGNLINNARYSHKSLRLTYKPKRYKVKLSCSEHGVG